MLTRQPIAARPASQPAISGGRRAGAPPRSSAQAGFNPRPPFLTGDAWLIVHAGKDVEFQSTPAISDGRRQGQGWCGWAGCGFNPRPPFLTGDAAQQQVAAQAQLFQSTPAISDGRRRASTKMREVMKCFNPRPPFLTGDGRRATGDGTSDSCDVLQFQSTPAISDGRRYSIAQGLALLDCFNPRPPFLTGDGADTGRGSHGTAVSIHARHF